MMTFLFNGKRWIREMRKISYKIHNCVVSYKLYVRFPLIDISMRNEEKGKLELPIY